MGKASENIYIWTVAIAVSLLVPAFITYFIFYHDVLVVFDDEAEAVGSYIQEYREKMLVDLNNPDKSGKANNSGKTDASVPKRKFQGFIPVLMYHHFNSGASSNTVVDPESFREQLIYLKAQWYETITVYDLLDAINRNIELPAKPLLITIDDGYLSNYEHAFPVLQELQMHATIFVVTSQRGTRPGFNEHFSWDLAKEMVESGWITIQSHTHDLHRKIETDVGTISALLGREVDKDGQMETDEQYRVRVFQDLNQSMESIKENVGQEVVSLTYPFGEYNAEVEHIAKETGFELLFTINTGLFHLEDSPFTIPRINIPGEFTGADVEAEIKRLLNERQCDPLYNGICYENIRN